MTNNSAILRVKKCNAYRKQAGVALISALVISFITTTLVATIIYRQQIQIRLSSNISTLEQNYQYAVGMENFAGTILMRSFEDQPNFVTLKDDWHSENGLVLPITGGLMSGKLHDLQARLNINSLIRERIEEPLENTANQASQNVDEENDGNTDTEGGSLLELAPRTKVIDVAKVTSERLITLIEALDENGDVGIPVYFVSVIKDWIDSDSDNGNSGGSTGQDNVGNGAETPYYQSIEPAYYSANTEMINPTELRLLKYMNEEFYKKFSKEVSTLPIRYPNKKSNQTPVNVNTASEQVLAALGFPLDAISEIINERKENPFKDIEDFKKKSYVEPLLVSDDIPTNLVDSLDIDVNSHYFLLEGKVEINNTRVFINSILYRNQKDQVSVIMRDFSNPQSIQKASQ